jgi:hypothetical protein
MEWYEGYDTDGSAIGLYAQIIDCLASDIRADILMQMFKNTRWKYVYQAWHEKQCMKSLRDSFIKKPRGLRLGCVVLDESRELSEDDIKNLFDKTYYEIIDYGDYTFTYKKWK